MYTYIYLEVVYLLLFSGMAGTSHIQILLADQVKVGIWSLKQRSQHYMPAAGRHAPELQIVDLVLVVSM